MDDREHRAHTEEDTHGPEQLDVQAHPRMGSIVIENVTPNVDGGRYAVKRVVGESVVVRADVFKEGHDILQAVVRYREVSPLASDWREAPMKPLGNDAWEGAFALEKNGRYVFTVEAWPDQYKTWVSELERKVKAGFDVTSELLEGAALLHGAAERARGEDAERMRRAATFFQGKRDEAIRAATDAGLVQIASRYADRSIGARYPQELEVFADRLKARFGSWYEFFPRSTGKHGKHGTFRTAAKKLSDVAALGFDVIYLPPIHPIGVTARKGRNNTLKADEGDVGSPWAIGAAEGGHKALHPELGTLDDFKFFLSEAARYGIEVAIDIAFQASPDHPYLKEHPEWFHRRPDGSIKTAENPPKRYEDIVNFDFLGPARKELWSELLSVVVHWVELGVRTFRVDNPHTKPIPFWEWLIRSVHDRFPDVVFLAEAFTRPKVMKSLAKIGFQQSYSYFTWRNFKQEYEEYLTESTQPPVSDYMRLNLWPNTPDILPEILQRGGPPAFKLRLALAATTSSVYGIYEGFELCENRAHHGEEYLDSEKYQLVSWDPERPGNIRSFVALINQIRKTHPSLQLYDNLRFYSSTSDRIIFYGKATPDGSDRILVAVNLDPYGTHESVLSIPLDQMGIGQDETYQVHELLSETRALWQGRTAHVRLTPDSPVNIWHVLRFAKTESSFDYYF